MTNVMCINCKCRKDMLCIPCSRDCESYYKLNVQDLISGKTTCAFFRNADKQYTFTRGSDNTLYTEDAWRLFDKDSNNLFLSRANIVINGIIYTFEDDTSIFVSISKLYSLDDYAINDISISLSDEKILFHVGCKLLCIDYDSRTNTLYINLVGRIGGDR